MPKNPILWVEDEPKGRSESAIFAKLRMNFDLCSASWNQSNSFTLWAAVRYLLEARFGNLPIPALLLLDYKLDFDDEQQSGEAHRGEALRLCQADSKTLELVRQCFEEPKVAGIEVLNLVGHLLAALGTKVVYASRFGEDTLFGDRGKEVLGRYPGILVGYHDKNADTPESLVRTLYEVLNDPRQGLSVDEIRSALPPVEADYLLGLSAENYEWSDAYRIALTELVRAGKDRAQPWADNPVRGTDFATYLSDRDGDRFRQALKGHKRLPRALICGERGAGKEAFARALHTMWWGVAAGQNPAPFIAINMGGIPSLAGGIALQLRLFGGERNDQQRRDRRPQYVYGAVPQAWNGTLFMDEIGYSHEDTQDALVRLIQDGEYEPALWGQEIWAAYCCFIGATNRPLQKLEDFRKDVVDRLSLHQIRLPALLDTLNVDLPNWMRMIASQHASHDAALPRDFEFDLASFNIAQSYNWPGNLRELSHAIRRMQLRAREENKSKIPIAIVASEVNRLRAQYAAAVSTGFSALPTVEEDLEVFCQKAAEWISGHTGGKTVSQEDLVNFARSETRQTCSRHTLQKHLETHFGRGAFERLLRKVATQTRRRVVQPRGARGKKIGKEDKRATAADTEAGGT
jgi:transcriptional regulator with AAA-type ATPase domain